MDLGIIKKKLSTFRSGTGKLMNVSDELLYELLMAWEQWTGPASGFYTALGADHRKMAKLIGRAKRLKREGVFPASEFKEIKVVDSGSAPLGNCQGIELVIDGGRVLRFNQVDLVLEYLKKAG